jgi:hypothetical protein
MAKNSPLKMNESRFEFRSLHKYAIFLFTGTNHEILLEGI